MDFREVKIKGEVMYDGKILKVCRDTVLCPNGNEAYREIIKHNGGACVLAITNDNCVFLEEQFRYAYDEMLYELPAGKLELNEDPRLAAIREFEEETSVKLTSDQNQYECFGKIKQNKNKNVYVFYKPYSNEDLTNCYSNSCVSVINGIEYEHKEIKAYKWMTIDEYKKNGIKTYIPYLEEGLTYEFLAAESEGRKL